MSPAMWRPPIDRNEPSDAVERQLQRWCMWQHEHGLSGRLIGDRLNVVREFGRRGVDVVRATAPEVDAFIADPSWSRGTIANYRSALGSWFRFLTDHGLRGVDPMAGLRGRAQLPPLNPAWSRAMEGWAMWMRAAGRPHTTVYQRTYQLHRIALALDEPDPWQVTGEALMTWSGSRDWAAETRRSYRSAMRSFFRWAVISGHIDRDPSITLPTVPLPAGIPKPAPDPVIKIAVACADDRVRAMLLLGACCGLRRAEISGVHADDVTGDLLRVRGKGNRERMVPLAPIVVQALAGLRAEGGFYFPGKVNGHLSPAYVGKLLSEALGPHWSGHSLRHRCASVAYSAERDLRAIQTLLGHSRPETTARYTAVPDGALRTAVMAAAL